MINHAVKERMQEGLWSGNAALVQLLGLCPLLAVSNSFVNAFGLGLATLFVLLASNTMISMLRYHVPDLVRIPSFIIIIASFTTVAELLVQAYAYPLYQSVGVFIPLIVTNCAILGRAESFASRRPVLLSALDGLMMGLGFALVLLLLGSLRELLGNGTLFSGANQIANAFGYYPPNLTLRFIAEEQSAVLLFLFPAGAFLLTGLLIAAKNAIDQRDKTQADLIASDKPAQ